MSDGRKNNGPKPKYGSQEELQTAIDAYYADCERRGVSLTMEGLAYALDISTSTLSNYGSEKYTGVKDSEGKNPLAAVVARARRRVLQDLAERGMTKDGATGAKLQLINNSERMGGMKYADKVEQSIDIAPITFVDDLGS